MKKLSMALLVCGALLSSSALAQGGVAISLRNGAANPLQCQPKSLNVFLNTATSTLSICTAANTWGALTIGGITQAAADLRYQPLDADLTAIAGLTSAADQLAYFTGSGTAALTLFTAAGRALVDDASASAQRTTLSLVPGTDVQAFDSDLSDLASSGSSGSGAFARVTGSVFTSFTTTGNVGLGSAASGTTGTFLLTTDTANESAIWKVSSSNVGTGALAAMQVAADASGLTIIAHGSGRVASRFGVTLGSYLEMSITSGNGLLVGTQTSAPLILGTNSTAAVTINGSTQAATFAGAASVTGTLTPSQTNGIVGTTTNNSANAGSVGELLSATIATGSSVSLTTNTAANVTSVSLTAGDWDCHAVVDYTFGATTSYSALQQGISTSSATLGAQDTFTSVVVAANVPGSATDSAMSTPLVRLSLSGTTTTFLVTKALFTVSTLKAYGTIRCRRVR